MEKLIANSCIKIETEKFPILEGEDEELVNENMYGKALCQYLEKELPPVGIKTPSYCCEDWGWWFEVENGEFNMGLCIYSDPEANGNPEKYTIMPSILKDKKWSWSKFKKVDVSKDVLKIMNSLENVFRKDREIKSVSRHDDFPF